MEVEVMIFLNRGRGRGRDQPKLCEVSEAEVKTRVFLGDFRRKMVKPTPNPPEEIFGQANPPKKSRDI